MNFVGKWKELEKSIVNNVSHTYKDKQYVLTCKWILVEL